MRRTANDVPCSGKRDVLIILLLILPPAIAHFLSINLRRSWLLYVLITLRHRSFYLLAGCRWLRSYSTRWMGACVSCLWLDSTFDLSFSRVRHIYVYTFRFRRRPLSIYRWMDNCYRRIKGATILRPSSDGRKKLHYIAVSGDDRNMVTARLFNLNSIIFFGEQGVTPISEAIRLTML